MSNAQIDKVIGGKESRDKRVEEDKSTNHFKKRKSNESRHNRFVENA